MGDKAILSEILEASQLTDAYQDLSAKRIINELKNVKRDVQHYQRFGNEGDDAMEGGSSQQGDQEQQQQTPSAGAPSQLPPTFTVDEAVEALGFGRFQLKLSLLTGFAWMADAMEMMLLSLLSPALVCEWGISSMQQALVTTCVFAGMMTSSTFWGHVCDRFGRKTGLTLSTLTAFSMGALSAIAPSYNALLMLRGLTGFGIGGVPQSVTLYAEFLPVAQRAKCVVLIESFWAIGAVFEAFLAFVIMQTWGWRWLLVFSSLPLLLFSVASVWLPESARFLLASGRTSEAYAVLQSIAKQNGTQMPKGELVQPKFDNPCERGHFSSLLKPDYKRTTLLLWCIWCINAFSYYGMVLFATVLFQSRNVCHGGDLASSVALNSTTTNIMSSSIPTCKPLTGDDYLSLLGTSFSEFPGLLITAAVIERFGRKRTMAAEFGVFAIFTAILFFCLRRPIMTTYIFVGRAFISGAFQCAYVYTPEVYPTTLRAVGLGASSAMARVGAIITPFVAQVASEQWLELPLIIYSVAAVGGVLASVALPIETAGRAMQDVH